MLASSPSNIALTSPNHCVSVLQGVHLDEPTSPASDRWPGHVSSPVKSQWTDEELEAFVKQLSNPQHQVTKVEPASPRKCSLDLCHELKDRTRARAPLARSETDTSVSFGDLDPPVIEKGRLGKSDDVSRGGGLISGLSGLRLIKNKKLARTSHAAKRYAAQKTREEPVEGGATENMAAPRAASTGTVTFSCGSSPEGSDVEVSVVTRPVEHVANGTTKEGGKKRRFRKILSRPLNRSQSAGCAKDVPAHALFVEQHRSKESVSCRYCGRRYFVVTSIYCCDLHLSLWTFHPCSFVTLHCDHHASAHQATTFGCCNVSVPGNYTWML